MPHLDEGTIHAWLDGALDPEEASRVEQHTSECAACAAAVAEARGLVAGASRILGALDHTPGNVIPVGSRPSSGAAKPSRSLWRALHVTPVRAAAAALLIVAAGTVLVARHVPNGSPALVEDEAGPEALQPQRAVSHVVADTTPAPAPSAAAAPSTSGKVVERRAQARERPARKTAAPPVVAYDAPRIAERAKVAAPAPARAGVAGGVAGAVASTSTADVEQRSLVAAPATRAIGGCYAVEADRAAGLPGRLVLDSSAVGANALLRAKPADSSVPARAMLKTVDASAPVAASWQPIGDSGIRVSIAGSAATPLDLHVVSPTTLMGTKTIGDRLVTITLHRTADCLTR